MLPLLIIALVASYFVGPTTFNGILLLGLVLIAVPFVVVAANKRYLEPLPPGRRSPRLG
ncbi:MAG: hypothetical protein ACXWUG_12585 [Polyangiales bacterium]